MRLTCGHDILDHVAVHEAGHAVVAVARGIDFRGVTLLPQGEIEAKFVAGETFMPGYVTPHLDDVSEWFTEGPEAAIDFLAAGAFTEQRLLKETVAGGLVGDIDLFKRGMGVKRFSDDEGRAWTTPAVGRLSSDWPTLEAKVKLIAELIKDRFETSRGSETFEISREEIVNALDDLDSGATSVS